MRILIVLIPISLFLLGIAVWAFIWAVRRGQFDDLDTPAIDVLADDSAPRTGPVLRGPTTQADDAPRP